MGHPDFCFFSSNNTSYVAGIASKASKASKAKPAEMGMDFMLKDPFYEPLPDETEPAIEAEPSIEGELLGLCKGSARPAPPKRAQATAGIFLPGGAKKAWAAAAKWPGKGRITSPAAMKAAAASSLKTAAEGPVTNAVCIDKGTGLAYYRHADGRLSPRAM